MLLIETEYLSIELHPNGRAKVPVTIWRRATEMTYVADAIDLMSAEARAKLVKRVPKLKRAEAVTALEQAAVRVARGEGRERKEETVRQGQAVAFTDPEPAPEPIDGAKLLDALAGWLRRFVVLPTAAYLVVAAWVMATYLVGVFDVAPYLVVRSPTKRCGKTLLMDLLTLLVRRPFSTVSASAATLFRMLDASTPTAFFDEAEVLGGQGERAEALREILNAGNRRGPGVPRCVGDDNEVRLFSVFGFKAIAAIGRLWDTLEDRALVIEMRRRAKGEAVARFRRRMVEPEAMALRRQLARWAQDYADEVAHATPDLPESLDDRAQDVWEPLLAVALVVGGTAYDRLVAAAKVLAGGREDDSATMTLLGDLRALLSTDKSPRTPKGSVYLPSKQLVEALHAMPERPWAAFGRAEKPITPWMVAKLLRGFGVRPSHRRVEDSDFRGYWRDECDQAFERYLPKLEGDGDERSAASEPSPPGGDASQTSQTSQPSNDATKSPNRTSHTEGVMTSTESPENPRGDSIVTRVTSTTTHKALPAEFEPVETTPEPPSDLWDGFVPPESPDGL